MDYALVDRLFLWWLANPAQPVLVGELNLVKTGQRGVSLTYARGWLNEGVALSEDLPLTDTEHLPKEKDAAAGAVDDARPDRWGERVIRHIDRPPRLSTLELLYFAGDDRFGALGVSVSGTQYLPRERGPLPGLGDVEALHNLVQRVLAGQPVNDVQRRLLAPGTLGGARPKALVQAGGAQWVLKFADQDMPAEPLVEHATMTLAAKAGIQVASTRLVPFGQGQAAVAVKRFDRESGPHSGGHRVHAQSAHVALRAAGAELSYPELAQLLRRRGPTEGDMNRQQMAELFRRMVFNILIDNTDDHEKNHVLLVRPDQQLLLSPAFDVLPTGHALGYQSLVVGARGAESSMDNALSQSRQFWLDPKAALAQAADVARVVDGWRAHFEQAGVPAAVIEQLGAAIDRPFLREQREKLMRLER
jgi:serine/threonine-protein kinase HipA